MKTAIEIPNTQAENGGAVCSSAVLGDDKRTRIGYVVQYKSVYEPTHWIDHHAPATHRTLDAAIDWAKGLRCVNPNVRILKRTITDEEVA